ncbi:MAG: glycosyltransferase family 4 protein [Acidobacteriota bacterium]|nr:glycosyltransferase family 4 protein [Acidobacteriota bacterium]
MATAEKPRTVQPDRPRGRNAPSIWVISELYYPEETSTGYFMTGIAQALAGRFPVRVLCAQPTYSLRGKRAPTIEVHENVAIRRVWSTTLANQTLGGRFANLVTITGSVFLNALFRIKAKDRVLVESTPPTLPFTVALACLLRRAHCIAFVQDTYPEVLIAAGMIRKGSLLARSLDRANRLLYRLSTRVVVLGRGMQDRVRHRLRGHDLSKVRVIRSWADIGLITAQPRNGSPFLERLAISDKFVVQFAGNISRLNDVENLVECMTILKLDTGIHFLFVGRGGRRDWLAAEVKRRQLPNVTLSKSLPRSKTAEMHRACDVVLIPLIPGMGGVAVPSRLYNSLASGRAIIAVTEEISELARIVTEEEVGWVVPPGDAERLAQTIRRAAAEPEIGEAMGERARAAAETRFSQRTITDKWIELFRELEASL